MTVDAPATATSIAPEIAIDHPRFRSVCAAIFTRRLAPDCMVHRCTIVQDEAKADLAHPYEKLDACCQYGCDVDLAEREAILARTDDVRALLRPEAASAPWFDDAVEEDPDYPSGKVVRTAVHGGGCIFLAHDRRGCAIHRASLERGWDFRGVKPAICRLFPLSYEADAIVIADEYPEYSCAHVDGPSLYRITRDTLAELFGPSLVDALDDAEARVLAAASPPPRRLPLAPSA
jgi:Fe-S-cluster containining protein